jgi:hypothetical protein
MDVFARAQLPAFFVNPPNFRVHSKPNKTNDYERRKIGPTLPGIIPQKRTIKAVVHRTNFMQEEIRKIVLHPEKVHKSAQKAHGNHLTTLIPSTT